LASCAEAILAEKSNAANKIVLFMIGFVEVAKLMKYYIGNRAISKNIF